jgi:predicted nucleic acid-binding Zn ribbon protein
MKSRFYCLGDLVTAGLERVGLKGAVKERAAVEIWSGVVGNKTASVTKVDRVRDGIIYVTCRDSMWAQQLHFLRPLIIGKLNERLGGEVIKEIRLSGRGYQKGADREEERARSEKSEKEPVLTESDLAAIDAAVGGIENPELAERVMRALRAGRALRKRHE